MTDRSKNLTTLFEKTMRATAFLSRLPVPQRYFTAKHRCATTQPPSLSPER
jgi:hypothetical protein